VVRHQVVCKRTGETQADFPGDQYELAKLFADRLAEQDGEPFIIIQSAQVYKTKAHNDEVSS
jgi:hypothetical protein